MGTETSAVVVCPLIASVEGAAASLHSTGIFSGSAAAWAEASTDLFLDVLLVEAEVFLVAASPRGLAALAAALAAATRLAASLGLDGVEVAALSMMVVFTLAVVVVPVVPVVLDTDLAEPELMVVTAVLVFATLLEAEVLLLGFAVAMRGAVVDARETIAVVVVLADPVLEAAEAATGALAAFVEGDFFTKAEDCVDIASLGLEAAVEGFFGGTVREAAAAGALGGAAAAVPPPAATVPPALLRPPAAPRLPPPALNWGRGVLDAAPAAFVVPAAGFSNPTTGFAGLADVFGAVPADLDAPDEVLTAGPSSLVGGLTFSPLSSEVD